MSLRDLKKSTPSSDECVSALDIDAFIEGAHTYAYGLGAARAEIDDNGRTKNATFSLTEQSTNELQTISKRTGICKSRLLRLLVHDQYYSDDQWLFQQSIK
ncbi:ribbon-helix-helix domain-containing protein [Ningiella sp. W23]|uniref:ribbon-helix-helix domain-containing protein n=1 Tax=Ningiella sp. W23 TaxID=3023715 RepID=UPI003757328B